MQPALKGTESWLDLDLVQVCRRGRRLDLDLVHLVVGPGETGEAVQVCRREENSDGENEALSLPV